MNHTTHKTARKWVPLLCLLAAGMLWLIGCGAAPQSTAGPSPSPVPAAEQSTPEQTSAATPSAVPDTGETTLRVQVGETVFTARLEDNEAADALAELVAQQPLILSLREYGGFEKVGDLGQALPAQDSQTTTQAGDIVLYQGDQIVLFYGSNSWSYTRLGRIDDLTGWEDALGDGDVEVTLSPAD